MNITQPTPVRLYLLQLALIEDGTPLPAYLIQMSDGKNVEWQTLLEMSEKVEHKKRSDETSFLLNDSFMSDTALCTIEG